MSISKRGTAIRGREGGTWEYRLRTEKYFFHSERVHASLNAALRYRTLLYKASMTVRGSVAFGRATTSVPLKIDSTGT